MHGSVADHGCDVYTRLELTPKFTHMDLIQCWKVGHLDDTQLLGQLDFRLVGLLKIVFTGRNYYYSKQFENDALQNSWNFVLPF